MSAPKQIAPYDIGSIVRNSLIFGIPVFVAAVGNEILRQLGDYNLGPYAELIAIAIGTLIKVVDRWARKTPVPAK